VGHVFVRLSGFGLRLVPYWPYEFARNRASVEVTNWTYDGPRSALIERGRPSSVDGVVDVMDGPEHRFWRVETSLFGFEWPEGFSVASAQDDSDHTLFYLKGPDDAVVYPQGPLADERVPPPAELVAPGQEIVQTYAFDNDVHVVELAYEHEGKPWWQSHWKVPVGASRVVVFSGQAPAVHADITRAAVKRIVTTLGATSH
jgi:hypothetical protein